MRPRTALIALPAALTFAFTGAGAAFAADGSNMNGSNMNGMDHTGMAGMDHSATQSSGDAKNAVLEILNSSGGSGTAMLSLKGDKLTVRIHSTGLVPNAPHAQHLHGMPDGKTDFRCPTGLAGDTNGDGILSVAEGAPLYGPISISLTTKGDTTDKSGLDVGRMPTADANGVLDYERTITVNKAVQENLANLHVVQHGIDVNDDGTYDFGAGKSELDEALPLEATAPANCGEIAGATVGAVPAGGVETGSGSTGGTESPALLALGGTTLAAAGALALVARRRRSSLSS